MKPQSRIFCFQRKICSTYHQMVLSLEYPWILIPCKSSVFVLRRPNAYINLLHIANMRVSYSQRHLLLSSNWLALVIHRRINRSAVHPPGPLAFHQRSVCAKSANIRRKEKKDTKPQTLRDIKLRVSRTRNLSSAIILVAGNRSLEPITAALMRQKWDIESKFLFNAY